MTPSVYSEAGEYTMIGKSVMANGIFGFDAVAENGRIAVRIAAEHVQVRDGRVSLSVSDSPGVSFGKRT